MKRNMEQQTNNAKVMLTAVFSLLSSLLGALAIPVGLMVAANIIDYITGLIAHKSRNEDINSYKSMRGIFKKVCMWLLVVVGAIIDQLLLYTSEMLGITLPFTFLVACIVAVWIVCNEIISILENIQDAGVNIPTFLEPLVKNIRSQTEHKITIEDQEEE